MEQHKSYLLPANATSETSVLAIAYGVLLFSSSASWKIISVACIPLPSLYYKYEKKNRHSSVVVRFLVLLSRVPFLGKDASCIRNMVLQ